MSLKDLIFLLLIISVLVDITVLGLNLVVTKNPIRNIPSKRVKFGTLGPEEHSNSVFDWHLAVFYSPQYRGRHMVGNAIVIDGEYIIANRQVGPDPVIEDSQFPSNAILPTPIHFNAKEGIDPNGYIFRYNFAGEPETPYLGYRNRMGVYELDGFYGNEFLKLEIEGPKVDEKPILSHYNGGDPCTAYAWSKHPKGYNKHSTQTSDQLVFYTNFTVYVDCTSATVPGTRCLASAFDIKVCDQYADDGIPVLCGRENKLTFLLTHRHLFPDCEHTFEAYPIAPLIKVVKELKLQRENEVKQPPTYTILGDD